MPSTILSDNGVTSGTSGIKTTGSNDGTLALQTTTAGGAATTGLSISTAQVVTLTNALPVASGGTGLATLTANNVLVGNGTGNVTFVAPSTSGNALISNGTSWASSAIPAGSAATPTALGTVFGLMDSGSAGITATGWSAGAGLTSGANNVFNGFRAGYTTSSGVFHTFVGPEAGYGQTTGQRSVAVGYKALYATSTSSYNVAVGSEALTSNTGNNNTAVGYLAGTSVTSGTNNTYIGTEAGGTHATGDGCTYVGYKTRSSTTSIGNEFVFGFNCVGNGGASATIGDAVGQIYVQYRGTATWNQVSDIRLKKNITPDTLGLSFIQRLNPVTYQWKASNELDEDNPYYA